MLRKRTWLTVDDVEAHFLALCDDPLLTDIDPYAGTEQFIHTFAGRGLNQKSCLDWLDVLRRAEGVDRAD